MSAVPYLGAKIALTSNVGRRYQGVLMNVDGKNGVLALQNVLCFGDEGASPDVKPFMQFKGTDIQEISVVEEAPSAAFDDPAVLSASSVPPPQPAQQARQPYRDAHQQHAPPAKELVVPDTEFDFQQANARFEKKSDVDQAEEDAARRALEDMEQQPAYDKSKSFFDDISTDMQTAEERRRQYYNNRQDTETFGDVAQNYKPRGGGRRRGGRGRNRRGGGGGGGGGGDGGGGSGSRNWRKRY